MTGTTYTPAFQSLLETMTFTTTGDRNNDVTFFASDYIPEVDKCEGGPLGQIVGPCEVYAYPSHYFFADSTRSLTEATGPCHLLRPGLAQCYSPSGLYRRYSYLTVRVNVSLGDGNDTFRSAGTGGISPATFATERERYIYTVDGGAGDDKIVLLDRTGSDEGDPADDVITCGAGNDTVVTLPHVSVSSDCETVTVVPAGNDAGPV